MAFYIVFVAGVCQTNAKYNIVTFGYRQHEHIINSS